MAILMFIGTSILGLIGYLIMSALWRVRGLVRLVVMKLHVPLQAARFRWNWAQA